MSNDLRADQIRLVSLLNAENTEEPLHVSRRYHYSFPEQSQSYVAISYTWGLDRTRINCDDSALEVSSSLVPALRQLHKRYPTSLYWTDSISIDQEHPGEKAHQVSMMGTIFASAATVAVWLGEGTADIYEVLHDPDMYTTTNEKMSQRRVDFMRRLSGIPWFYRAWTFQEIRLAKEAVVMLGDEVMNWQDFVLQILELRRLEPRFSTVEIRSQPRSYSRFAYEPQDPFFGMLDDLNTGVSSDLTELLFVTWYREATLKHDKVYSLLSSALLDNSSHGIHIDYDIAWSELCIRTARRCISTGMSLKILRIAGLKQRWKSPMTNRWNSEEVKVLWSHPSWAPDWWAPPQQTRSRESLVYDERGCFTDLAFCCPETPPLQSIDNTSPFLILKGVVLGIINIGDPPSFPGGPTLVHAPPHCAMGQPQEWLKKPVGCQSTPLLQGICKVSMLSFVEEVQQHLHGNCMCVPYHERTNGRLDTTPSHMSTTWEQVHLRFSDTNFPIHDRQGIVGDDDRVDESALPAGVLATSVESGDWLVLLEGGGMPFILRPVMDPMGRASRLETLMTPQERSRVEAPYDAGCFVLVGEASMCWDQLWPGGWDTYCRAGDFALM